MIHIVTGEINSGKTTRLLAEYKRHAGGDGFILPKSYLNGLHAGQTITRLSTGLQMPFSMKEGFIPGGWDEAFRFGSYSFSKAGLDFAFQIAAENLLQRVTPAFIDEAGPVELNGLGLAPILSECFSRLPEVYVVVRSSCLDDIIKVFGIKEFVLISDLQNPCPQEDDHQCGR